VGTTSATQTAEVTFTTAGTPGTISVVTQGASGLDFAFVSGGTCSTSTAYTIGQSCTVQYTFTPNATGPRYGAVVLSSGATVLGTSYLSGTGTGPVAGFTQSSFSGAADGVGGNVQYPALVLGGTSPNPTGNGNVLYIPNNSNVLYKDTVGTGTAAFYTGAGSARYRGAGVDGAGNVYVSDVISNNVFKLSSSGTLLATWPVSGVSLSSPWGMVFGTDGTLYVANPGANDIVAITPAGVASVLPVSGYSFTAYSLAIDGSNNLYIPDNANSRILKVPGNSGAGGAATLVSVTGTAISAPGGVAIDSAGELYVTEGNSTVLRISAAGVSAAVPETGFSFPAGVVTDNRGHVYVMDQAVASLFTLTLASPPALSFGSVTVGSSSPAQTETLLNSGNASLSLASVTASNANFTGALGTCGATLASGISCAPSFAFTPQATGSQTGNGIVIDNSLNASGSPQTVALGGTGTPPPTITSYTPNPVPTGGNITVTATGTSLSGTTGVCIFQGGSLLDCDSTSNVTATSFTFVTSPSIGAGTYCLRVGMSTGNPCINYTVSATAGVFGSLTVTGFASPAVITEAGTATVTAYDTYGSVDQRFTGTVTLTSSDAHATLPSPYTFTSADAGVHVFNGTLNSLGTESITATSGSVTASQTGILVGDAIWVLNAAGTLDKLSRTGSLLTSSVGTSGTAASYGGTAFDSSGNVWSVTSAANSVLFTSKLAAGTATKTGAGLNAPVSVAVDGAGYIWIANSGGNTVSEFTNAGVAQSPGSGYGSSYVSGNALNAPSAIAIDQTGGVWVTNKSGSTVTHIFGAAAPTVTPLSSATATGTLGTKP
jgi:sugar lactone lactonase YvrE